MCAFHFDIWAYVNIAISPYYEIDHKNVKFMRKNQPLHQSTLTQNKLQEQDSRS